MGKGGGADPKMALYVGLDGNLTEQALVDTDEGQGLDLLVGHALLMP